MKISTRLFFATSNNSTAANTTSTAGSNKTSLHKEKNLISYKQTRHVEIICACLPSVREARRVCMSRHDRCAGGYHHHEGAPQGSLPHRGPLVNSCAWPCTYGMHGQPWALVCQGVHLRRRCQRWRDSCNDIKQCKDIWAYGLQRSGGWTTYSVGFFYCRRQTDLCCVVIFELRDDCAIRSRCKANLATISSANLDVRDNCAFGHCLQRKNIADCHLGLDTAVQELAAEDRSLTLWSDNTAPMKGKAQYPLLLAIVWTIRK